MYVRRCVYAYICTYACIRMCSPPVTEDTGLSKNGEIS
jgi:hypothetical protein